MVVLDDDLIHPRDRFRLDQVAEDGILSPFDVELEQVDLPGQEFGHAPLAD